MKLRSVLLGLALCLIHLASAGQTLHLIVVGDTNDVSIGGGVKGNIDNVARWMENASKSLDVPLKKTIITGSQFNCKAFADVTNPSSITSNDTLVFYYSGHGYRLRSDTSKFPSFFCGQEVFLNGAPGLVTVADSLTKTGARLVIAIADTCNIVIAESGTTPAVNNFQQPNLARKSAYSRLLLAPRGVLLISSSSPGQYSWYYPTHGIFTSQLLDSLEKFTGIGGSGQWDDVLDQGLTRIRVPTGPIDGDKFIDQDPQADKSKLRL